MVCLNIVRYTPDEHGGWLVDPQVDFHNEHEDHCWTIKHNI